MPRTRRSGRTQGRRDWAARTGRTEFRAYQASQRGGEIACRLLADGVEPEGACVFYLEGQIEI